MMVQSTMIGVVVQKIKNDHFSCITLLQVAERFLMFVSCCGLFLKSEGTFHYFGDHFLEEKHHDLNEKNTILPIFCACINRIATKYIQLIAALQKALLV